MLIYFIFLLFTKETSLKIIKMTFGAIFINNQPYILKTFSGAGPQKSHLRHACINPKRKIHKNGPIVAVN